MSVQLNHTIVSCRDQQRSAAFLTGILGLPPATRFAHFLVVEADNGVSLDFAETSGAITAQHYAFLVGEEEFDAAFGRIRQQDLPYWADPGRRQAGVINTRDGGRGVYFEDPDGHLLGPRRPPARAAHPPLRQRFLEHQPALPPQRNHPCPGALLYGCRKDVALWG
jgi:catechol 2,3-dioxygenase-like lactoylglutathione lyase family enzyme